MLLRETGEGSWLGRAKLQTPGAPAKGTRDRFEKRGKNAAEQL
jgi:hypothetical protein